MMCLLLLQAANTNTNAAAQAIAKASSSESCLSITPRPTVSGRAALLTVILCAPAPKSHRWGGPPDMQRL